jgi:hypothetical protein
MKLPSIQNINTNYINEIYVDAVTKTIRTIKFEDIFIFVEPYSEIHKLPGVATILFDYNSLIISVLNKHEKKITLISEDKNYSIMVIQLIYKYIFIYLMQHKEMDISDFNETLIKNKKIKENTEIRLINGNISWKLSVISQKDFDSFVKYYNNTIESNIKIIYDSLVMNYDLRKNMQEDIYTKNITGI